jgi:hypothetical protein
VAESTKFLPAKPFQPGNKLAKGGARPGAGRPSKAEKQELLTLAKAIEQEGLRRAARLAKRYYEMAEADPPTMRHVVDGTRVNNGQQQSNSTTYQFIQFNNNQNSVQLPPEGIPTTVLVSDERGQEESGKVLASPIGEGQDGPQFHSFAHVSRKPR